MCRTTLILMQQPIQKPMQDTLARGRQRDRFSFRTAETVPIFRSRSCHLAPCACPCFYLRVAFRYQMRAVWHSRFSRPGYRVLQDHSNIHCGSVRERLRLPVQEDVKRTAFAQQGHGKPDLVEGPSCFEGYVLHAVTFLQHLANHWTAGPWLETRSASGNVRQGGAKASHAVGAAALSAISFWKLQVLLRICACMAHLLSETGSTSLRSQGRCPWAHAAHALPPR